MKFTSKLARYREVQLTVMQYYRWETMKKEGDKFAESILRKHFLVSGVEL